MQSVLTAFFVIQKACENRRLLLFYIFKEEEINYFAFLLLKTNPPIPANTITVRIIIIITGLLPVLITPLSVVLPFTAVSVVDDFVAEILDVAEVEVVGFTLPPEIVAD